MDGIELEEPPPLRGAIRPVYFLYFPTPSALETVGNFQTDGRSNSCDPRIQELCTGACIMQLVRSRRTRAGYGHRVKIFRRGVVPARADKKLARKHGTTVPGRMELVGRINEPKRELTEYSIDSIVADTRHDDSRLENTFDSIRFHRRVTPARNNTFVANRSPLRRMNRFVAEGSHCVELIPRFTVVE